MNMTNDLHNMHLPATEHEDFRIRRIDVHHQEQSNNDIDVTGTNLSEDTFSFLIVAPLFSIPFSTGVVVLGIKTTMYTLILADMMTKGTPNNILGIPASLELPVVVSQALAVASKLRNNPSTSSIRIYCLNS
jgi:hypothetical protein